MIPSSPGTSSEGDGLTGLKAKEAEVRRSRPVPRFRHPVDPDAAERRKANVDAPGKGCSRPGCY